MMKLSRVINRDWNHFLQRETQRKNFEKISKNNNKMTKPIPDPFLDHLTQINGAVAKNKINKLC